MIETPKRYSKSNFGFNREITENDRDDLLKVYRWYQTGIRATNECVEKGDLSKEQAKKLKKHLTEDFIVSVYVIPEVNKISLRFESMISKNLERMLRKV